MNTQHNSRLHILIVEDNRTQAEFLKYILEKKRFRVSVALNGHDALEQIRREKPSIILTDVMMPGMDGYELCSRIKADNNTSDIPVILVTYLNNPANVIRGLEAGADNFIIKPFEPDSIYFHIHNTISHTEKVPAERCPELLEVQFLNEPHKISSTRTQILNILLSTYDTAVKNNSDLQVAHERLQYMNAQMQKAVDDLQHANEKLIRENRERNRVERALSHVKEKNAYLMAVISDLLGEKISSANSKINQALTDQETGCKGSWDTLRDSRDLLSSSLDIIARIGTMRVIGTDEPVWHNLRDIAREYSEIPGVIIKNDLPDTIEIFADPLLEEIPVHLNSYLSARGMKEYSIRFFISSLSTTLEMGIIAEDAGFDSSLKNNSVSPVSDENVEMQVIQAILSITGMTIRETDHTGEGIFFAITVPEDMVQSI